MSVANVRRRAREKALQFLFSLEFNRYAWTEAIDDFWTVHPSRDSVRKYAEILIRGVAERAAELDAEIAGALRQWSPDRIGPVERTALRIALFEMRYVPGVPPAVAINEAIEVVKAFGAEDAGKFVNAVLDRLRENSNEEPAGNA